jgi:NADH-quinone oxidoreductase subunit G
MVPTALAHLQALHSTLEELHLASSLMRGIGSENIDYRCAISPHHL